MRCFKGISFRSLSTSCRPFEEIPAPRAVPLLGTLPDIIRAGGVAAIHKYIDARHRELGPIFREQLGHVQAVWICDTRLYQQVYQQEGKYPQPMLPEPWLIYNRKHGHKRGLFFMQGEEWAEYRKILSPLLLKLATLRQHINSLEEAADSVVQRWKSAPDGRVTNLEGDLYDYFVKGIMCTAFGSSLSHDARVWESLVPQMIHHLRSLFEQSAKLTLLPPSLAASLRLPVWNRFESAASGALGVARQLMAICMEDLQRKSKDGEQENCVVGALQNLGIQHQDIERIVADLFLAAADTTSHSMQWILYILARNPGIQDQIFEEMKGSSSEDHWQDMHVMKGVVKEAFRLYPVAPFLTRILPEDSVIGNYQIPAKTLALLSVYSSGRDPAFVKDPESILPERWKRDSGSTAPDPYASLPFGYGKRSCIGRRLAETQIYLLITKALKNFKLQSENEVQMVMRLLGTVHQPVGLHLHPRIR